MRITLDNVRFRKFAPIDREQAIFELIDNDIVLLDVTSTDAGDFEVGIHQGAVNRVFVFDELMKLLQEGRTLVEEDLK